MASTSHTPENATLRARVTIGGKERLLFYVPSSKADERPYLFACGPEGEYPSCECAYRWPHKRGVTCQLIERAAEVAAKVGR